MPSLSRLPIWFANRGNHDLALLLDKMLRHTPGYGESLEGWLLLDAAQYGKAREFYKPLAFDETGKPRLTSWHLAAYAVCLAREGKDTAAQELYEAALQAPQDGWGFHIGLADCLLTQKKDADRARALMEQVLATKPEDLSTPHLRADWGHHVALYGYALASCGRRAEAEEKLAEAYAISEGIEKRRMAALHHVAGAAWQALGEREKAQSAFTRSLQLHPHGDIAWQVRRKLALSATQ